MLGCPPSSSLSYLQLVNVRVEDPIHEPDTRRLVRVLVGQLDVDFPDATFEGSCVWGVLCEQPAVCGGGGGPERQGERTAVTDFPWGP